MARSLDDLFAALARSEFRSRFRLRGSELEHPVFATATCCRGCLAKWHSIPGGRELDASDKQHVLTVLERWLRAQEASDA